MKDKHRTTTFYMEILILVAVFTSVILLLADVFAAAREQTNQAKLLTSAVELVEHSAELAAGASDGMELFRLLDQDGNTAWLQEGSSLRARYDPTMTPDRDGSLWVELSWEEEDGLTHCHIQALWRGEPVYELETAVYRGGSAS